MRTDHLKQNGKTGFRGEQGYNVQGPGGAIVVRVKEAGEKKQRAPRRGNKSCGERGLIRGERETTEERDVGSNNLRRSKVGRGSAWTGKSTSVQQTEKGNRLSRERASEKVEVLQEGSRPDRLEKPL